MRRPHAAFTLIELLVTIAIIGMLAVLLAPTLGRARAKAESVKCANNLRGIGAAVMLYTQDNDNRFPMIESMPTNPVYPPGSNAGTLLSVLAPYGVNDALLRCPADIAGKNYYKKEGASYMWRPLVDDELVTAPKIYSPRRGEIVPPLSRLPLAADYTNVHRGHINCVFADGHVRTF
ncbi:MAG: type II secretion system protein [Terrimicrobiaceae bacterium]|nr:type II secretion system protein [Terrimicrobiaceae bacterium]